MGRRLRGHSPDELVNWHEGDFTAPLLLGWDLYDIYWRVREGEPYRLVAEDVDVRGEVVEVPFSAEHLAPRTP